MGVELIFINPVDWTKIEPALELAHAAKIPVIAIDTNVEDDLWLSAQSFLIITRRACNVPNICCKTLPAGKLPC